MLARAREAGVRLFAVTFRPSDFRMLFPLYGRRDGVRLALGLHPLEVAKVDLPRELDLFRRYASHTSYIGEVGLDHSAEGRASWGKQEQALQAVLGTPGVSDKVLTVHSRGAASEVIAALRAASASRAILHWFSGSLRELGAALDAGFFFSINPRMTRTATGQRLIARIPRARFLLESDGPFARLGTRPLEPRDVWLVVSYLAEHWNVGEDEVAVQLEENLRALLAGLLDERGRR